MNHGPELHIDVLPAGDRVIVAPAGEIDIATVPQLEVALADARERGFEHVVLDLRAVAFMDSTGLKLLVRERAAAIESGGTFDIAHEPGPVRRVLELTGTLQLFEDVELDDVAASSVADDDPAASGTT